MPSDQYPAPPSFGDDSKHGPVLPPSKASRTLVLCFDGTGNSLDAANSNVLYFFTMLKKNDSSQQLVYYQTGIGTYTTSLISTPVYTRVSKTLDMMGGYTVGDHIMKGYEFLMQSYREGDKICLFGFSRGAYTACALAAMVNKVGLLPAGHFMQIPLAYKIFARNDETSWRQGILFKQTLASEIGIEFVGVWDTVGSIQRGLQPFTFGSRSLIRHFRHALALDEHRVKFRPSFYRDFGFSTPKEDTSDPRKIQTDVQEVWFAGSHSDVGGGDVSSGVKHVLAHIPLRWMVRQCFMANTGIQFYSDRLRRIGLDPDALYPTVVPRPPLPLPAPSSSANAHTVNDPKVQPRTYLENGCEFETEEQMEAHDALAPSYNQLELTKFWWILELFPVRSREQRADGTWVKKMGPHRGSGRNVLHQKDGIRVHRSVKARMATGYIPRVKLEVEPTWVD